MPARACGTMRTPAAAQMNRNTARTICAMTPASLASSLLAHERRGAPDLDHLDPRPRLDDLVLVVGAGGPGLPLQPHAAAVLAVDDALGHRRGAPDQRRRPRAQLRRLAAVRAGDGSQGEQQ